MGKIRLTDTDGKLTQRIDIPVTEELNDAVTAIAVIAGMNKAEYIRGLIERTVLGELTMLRRVGGLRWSSQREDHRK